MLRPSPPPWAPKRLPPPRKRQRSSSFPRPTRSHAHRCSRPTRQHGGEQSGLVTLPLTFWPLLNWSCSPNTNFHYRPVSSYPVYVVRVIFLLLSCIIVCYLYSCLWDVSGIALCLLFPIKRRLSWPNFLWHECWRWCAICLR